VIVADTHIWIWWVAERHRLSRRALDVLTQEQVAVSVMTAYEVASLAARNRIVMDAPGPEQLQEWLDETGTLVINVDTRIALRAASLRRDVLRDPTDRLIVATALHHNAQLVTADRKIQDAGLVATIW
jgi:PIN domain nuclease of toxin-antitoxin system